MGTITVSLYRSKEGDENSEETVHAVPNPQIVEPGEELIWRFDPTVGDRKLRVKLEGSDPFTGPLSHEAGQIVGTIRQDVARDKRFTYKFVEGENDEQVTWGNRLENEENFGGLDVPPPPPRNS